MVYRGKKPNQRHVVKQTSNKQHAFGENSKSKVHFNYANLKAWTKLGETVLEHGVNTLQRLKSTHSVSSTWKSSLPVLYNVILPNFFFYKLKQFWLSRSFCTNFRDSPSHSWPDFWFFYFSQTASCCTSSVWQTPNPQHARQEKPASLLKRIC